MFIVSKCFRFKLEVSIYSAFSTGVYLLHCHRFRRRSLSSWSLKWVDRPIGWSSAEGRDKGTKLDCSDNGGIHGRIYANLYLYICKDLFLHKIQYARLLLHKYVYVYLYLHVYLSIYLHFFIYLCIFYSIFKCIHFIYFFFSCFLFSFSPRKGPGGENFVVDVAALAAECGAGVGGGDSRVAPREATWPELEAAKAKARDGGEENRKRKENNISII